MAEEKNQKCEGHTEGVCEWKTMTFGIHMGEDGGFDVIIEGKRIGYLAALDFYGYMMEQRAITLYIIDDLLEHHHKYIFGQIEKFNKRGIGKIEVKWVKRNDSNGSYRTK